MRYCLSCSWERPRSPLQCCWVERPEQVWGWQGEAGSEHPAPDLRGAVWTSAERLFSHGLFLAGWGVPDLPDCFGVSCFAHSCPCCLSLYFVLLLKQQMFSLSSKEMSWHPSYHEAANPGCVRVAAQTVHWRVHVHICLQAEVPQMLFGNLALMF